MATYEWTTDKRGNQKYRRVDESPRVQRISEVTPPPVVTGRSPKGGEMAIEAPEGNFVAKVDSDAPIVPVEAVDIASASVVVPAKAPVKAPIKRRTTRAKK